MDDFVEAGWNDYMQIFIVSKHIEYNKYVNTCQIHPHKTYRCGVEENLQKYKNSEQFMVALHGMGSYKYISHKKYHTKGSTSSDM